MYTTIKIFENQDFGQIRTAVDEKGEPLFCLTDVCKILELTPSKVVQRLDKDVLSKYPLRTAGGSQLFNFVNEDGLYDTILDSRKPEAKRFRKWVTSEVLPQIRRTGGYIPVREEDDEKTILAKAVLILNKTLEQKDELLEAQRPKVQFAEAIIASDGSILIRDLAKLLTQNGITIGQNRLFSWLRQHGYIFKNETRPIQIWVERGIFDTTVTSVATHHGTKEVCTTKVTGKGQEYFLNGFLNGSFVY